MRTILLSSVLCFFICIKSYSCHLGNEKTNIKFLTAKEAGEVLSDTTNDKYLLLLNPMEMASKTGKPLKNNIYKDQLSEIIQRYKTNTLDFTKKEKEVIEKITNKVSPTLLSHYSIFNNYHWQFLKVTDSIEGGMPHTRGYSIVLSESICGYILKSYEKNELKAIKGIEELFVHELFHIVQRDNPNLFDSIYKDKWGFIKVDNLNCEWLNKHVIINPDGPDWKWIFPLKSGNRFICPNIVFMEPDTFKKFHNDMKFVAIDVIMKDESFEIKLDSNNKPVMENLYDIKKYNDFFAPSHNHYNPDELSADLFARMFFFDYHTDQDALSEEKRNRLVPVFNELRPLFESLLNN